MKAKANKRKEVNKNRKIIKEEKYGEELKHGSWNYSEHIRNDVDREISHESMNYSY